MMNHKHPHNKLTQSSLKSFAKTFLSIALLSATVASADDRISAEEAALPDVVVTAEFRETTLQNLATSATVISEETIDNLQAQHLEQVLGLAPNLNFSSGASRGRYIQIRGIGERSQFIQPLSNSVAILIDGIDFTGIGAAATTLDLEQVEILRGPQGTLYGANALAGLINLKSKDPSLDPSGSISATVGNYDTKTLSGHFNTRLNDQASLRVAAENHQSNGFTKNTFLDRDDTSNIDESTLRAKLSVSPNEHFDLDFTALYVDVDNGYDGFSLDNTRNTLSDQPGRDRQQSTAFAVKGTWSEFESFDVVGLVSYADSDLEYSFDVDWAHPNICDDTLCDFDDWGFDWSYNYFDSYKRNNQNVLADVKWVSKTQADEMSWVAGVYYRQQEVDLFRTYTSDDDFSSRFDTENIALYGQINQNLSEGLTLSAGLRFEQRKADYDDNLNVHFSPNEDLWGAKVSLEHINEDGRLVYGLISRGYKAGGFNGDAAIPADKRSFDTEFMWNYELGLKSQTLDGALQYQLALFYQNREDIQVKQSIVTPSDGDLCPCDFTDFTDNAAAGNNYGIEASFTYLLNPSLSVFASLGLLETEYKHYDSFEHVDADRDSGTPFSLDGRDQAHAPSYTYSLGGDFDFGNNWQANLTLEGKDAFYFSARHSVRSDSYTLVNARVSYEHAQWTLAFWGRNLSDEDVKVRAFGSFGNDPRKLYQTEPYYQFGDARMAGLSGSYRF
jgi:outer membrane receptor protein involved in Fe transport